jgi:hypothetical protein
MPLQTASVELNWDGTTPVLRIQTPDGFLESPIDLTKLSQGQATTVFYQKNPEPKPRKVSAKHQRRASIRQEDSIASDLGGKRQPGSGAVPGIKGDVKVEGIYRIEAKYTRSKTYRLDRTELGKIRGECSGLEVPLFIIDFVDPQTGGSPDRWVALPFHHFQRMKYEPPYETSHHRGST